jgi:hypothetical protein
LYFGHLHFLFISEVFPSAAGSGVPKACVGWSIACTAECYSNNFSSEASMPFFFMSLLQCPGYYCAVPRE